MRRRPHFLVRPLEDRIAPAFFNTLISRADPTSPSDAAGTTWTSNGPTMSADGRYLAFSSSAGDVVPGEVAINTPVYGGTDIYVFDKTSNTTELISHAYWSPHTTGNGASIAQTISADGRYVAFESHATDLVAGMTTPTANKVNHNIFVYDRTTQTCMLVSHQYTSVFLGDTFNGAEDGLATMSANGQTITFASKSQNLIAGFSDPGNGWHSFAYSVASGQLTLLDHNVGSPSGVSGSGGYPYGISADGRYVVISSNGKNLVSPSTSGGMNVFRCDLSTGQNILISKAIVSGTGGPDGGGGEHPRMSADGSCISFYCASGNLVAGYSGTGQISLVSHSSASSMVGGNGDSTFPQVSGNGQVICFSSLATNLMTGFVDGNSSSGGDLFLYNRASGQTALVSHKAGSALQTGNNYASGFSVSADGQFVFFIDSSSDLIAGFTGHNTYGDGFGYNRLTGAVFLVDGKDGSAIESANNFCQYGEVSADGSSMTFITTASDIVPGVYDGDGLNDVFVRNLASGDMMLASRRFGTPSASAGGDSNQAKESADGRYVVYTSLATNLVPGQVDIDGSQDVFLYDRQLNTTTLVSHVWNSAATAANGQSALPVISADGRYVAYTSYATNLVHHFVDGNGSGVPGSEVYSGVDVFLFDRLTGTNTLISHRFDDPLAGGNQTSGKFQGYIDYFLTISGDGRYVGYFSLATDLVAGFVDNDGTTPSNNAGSDVFVFDRTTGVNSLVSHAAGSLVASGNDSSYAPSISADGRYIAFWSYSSTLVAGMSGGYSRNVFVLDQQTGLIALASHTAGSTTIGGNNWSTTPAISKDGHFVVYQSGATDLVSGGTDVNGQYDVFLYDVQAQTNTLISHAYNSPVNAGNYYSVISTSSDVLESISDDGRFVVYSSVATNLISGFVDGNDVNDHYNNDVYLFDRVTGLNTLVSHTAITTTTSGNLESKGQVISGDGRFIGFVSGSSDLTASYTSAWAAGNLFVFDRLFGTNTLASHSVSNNSHGGDDPTSSPSINDDGSVIAYVSQATNLVPNDFNTHQDVIAYVTPPPQVASLQINDGSVQRSTVRSITVTFDEPVFFSGDPAAAFTLTRNGSVGSVQLAMGGYTNSPNGVVTLNFSGPLTEFGSLVDGQYSLTIDASQVKNIANLDGTGAGVAGVNWVSQPGAIFRLFGDANGDGTVSASDFILFRMNFGGNANMFDFDGDGYVSASDFVQFRMRFGGSI
jgi:hypothetical protein